MEWYVMVWQKYAEFSGRSRRKEYWMFTLFNLLTYLVLFVGGLVILRGAGIILYFLYALAAFIPGLSVSVRRLHDTGKSGWFLLIALIPLVGGIILLVSMASDGNPCANLYGLDPKAAERPWLPVSYPGVSPLGFGGPPQPFAPSVGEGSFGFCGSCGAKLKDSSPFCSACGAHA